MWLLMPEKYYQNLFYSRFHKAHLQTNNNKKDRKDRKGRYDELQSTLQPKREKKRNRNTTFIELMRTKLNNNSACDNKLFLLGTKKMNQKHSFILKTQYHQKFKRIDSIRTKTIYELVNEEKNRKNK